MMSFKWHSYVLRNVVLFLISLLFSAEKLSASEWTLLVYVQANNNLSGYALKNFSDMAMIGSNSNLTTLVQWHAPNQQGTWRYRIDKGKMVLDECIKDQTDGNKSEDLVNSMAWAVRKYPSQKYSLVLWNHGIGILDPAWQKTLNLISNGNQKTGIDLFFDEQVPRIAFATDEATDEAQTIFDLMATSTRGILFNEYARTYMDNQTLKDALSKIKTNVLKNKKIDLLGMDACLMAMVEVAYQIKDYAEVFVASEEVELAHGWDYHAVTSLLSSKGTTAQQVGQGIVKIYENFYKDKINFYTQSAIELGSIESVKQSIDTMIDSFRKCTSLDKMAFSELARKARRSCVQFSSAAYIDLHSYCTELIIQLASSSVAKYKNNSALESLKNSLSQLRTAIDQTVLASTAGQQLARARGLSIYFPSGHIDYSYSKTDFALSSKWPQFIKEIFC